jgi:hypothetical protein
MNTDGDHYCQACEDSIGLEQWINPSTGLPEVYTNRKKVKYGFQMCQDVDECSERYTNSSGPACHALATCINIDAANPSDNPHGNLTHHCNCQDGFHGDGLPHADGCVDVNECAEPAFNCTGPAYVCENTIGNYTCECAHGFVNILGHNLSQPICVDDDECRGKPCHANATCTNTPGSFDCVCDEGMVGDGFSCTPAITECPNRQFADNDNECRKAYALECQDDAMIFKIFKDYMDFRGLVMSNIAFNDSSCVANITETVDDDGYDLVQARFELDSTCGTQSAAINDEWVYSNSLNLAGSEVDFIDSRPIPFSCHFQTRYNLTSEQFVKLVVLDIEDFGNFELVLETFDSDGFTSDLTEPVAEEDYVFIEISSSSMEDLNRKMYAQDCFLSNYDPERTSAATEWDEEIQLIDDGCEEHGDNETVILMNNVGGSVRFKSKVFTISDFEQAWVRCAIRFCDDVSCAAYEQATCPNVNSAASGRSLLMSEVNKPVTAVGVARPKAAAISGNIEDQYQVSLGPFNKEDKSAVADNSNSGSVELTLGAGTLFLAMIV